MLGDSGAQLETLPTPIVWPGRAAPMPLLKSDPVMAPAASRKVVVTSIACATHPSSFGLRISAPQDTSPSPVPSYQPPPTSTTSRGRTPVGRSTIASSQSTSTSTLVFALDSRSPKKKFSSSPTSAPAGTAAQPSRTPSSLPLLSRSTRCGLALASVSNVERIAIATWRIPSVVMVSETMLAVSSPGLRAAWSVQLTSVTSMVISTGSAVT